MPGQDYAGIARQYAREVLAGRIPACRWVRLTCQRQIDDLARFKGRSGPYRFNPVLTDASGLRYRPADRACAFMERLSHVKGPLAGEMIKLEPWQVFILTTVFGWVKTDGKRRFRRSYIEVPRGNGKALDIETLIPTPQGFKRMADLQVGDQVFDERGQPCTVTAVSDILHERPCYRVNFSTGESMVADAAHEWLTHAQVDRPGTKRI